MKCFSHIRLECRPLEDRVTPAGNGTTTKFNTNLTIKPGSGDDVTSLDTVADDGASVVGKLTVDSGLDLDWLDLGTTVSLCVPLVQTGCEISI